jgi:D-glycero-alpha-D-manno-heptose-7-phosphate kinase
MIITRTPFRISFAGGGSDLPSFYHKEIGAVLSTSIDKYMYIVIHPFFDKSKIQLKYSKTELVSDVKDIQHPIIREVLKMNNLKGVDINSIADIPTGTGMGSSSSFTVGLINAVRAFEGKFTGPQKLSEMACDIEIKKVGSPIGKQDQYAAAFGGLNFIEFFPDETVKVDKVLMSQTLKKKLEDDLILIYIGGKHNASSILSHQAKALSDESKFETQRKMVKLAYNLRDSLNSGHIEDFGMYLNEGWQLKKSLTNDISNNGIDSIYEKGIKAGALGGKLLGAGGAGFILFFCPKEKQERFRQEMVDFQEMSFHFDNYGSQVIYVGDKY